MGHRPYDSVLRPDSAGKTARTKRTKDYETCGVNLAGSLRGRYSPAVACRRGILRRAGRVADPDKDKSALGDEGGNTFTLELSDEPPRGRGMHKKKFHGFWDYDAVNTLFPRVPGTLGKSELQALIEPLKKELVHEMATREPRNWRM